MISRKKAQCNEFSFLQLHFENFSWNWFLVELFGREVDLTEFLQKGLCASGFHYDSLQFLTIFTNHIFAYCSKKGGDHFLNRIWSCMQLLLQKFQTLSFLLMLSNQVIIFCGYDIVVPGHESYFLTSLFRACHAHWDKSSMKSANISSKAKIEKHCLTKTTSSFF